MNRKETRGYAVKASAITVVSLMLFSIFLQTTPLGDETPGTGADAYIDESDLVVENGVLWVVPHSTDFSEDPGWITNNPANYFWNQTSETMDLRWVGGSDEYCVAPANVSTNTSTVVVEYDMLVQGMGVDSDMPMALLETDYEYRADSSIQFFFARNATTNTTRLESYDSTNLMRSDVDSTGFSLDTWYHVAITVEYNDGTVNARINRSGTATVLSNQTLSGIGTFHSLDKVGVSTVGPTGGTATAQLDNFTLKYAYYGPGNVDVSLAKTEYRPKQRVHIDAGYYFDPVAWYELRSGPYVKQEFAWGWNDEERFLVVFGGSSPHGLPNHYRTNDTLIYYAENNTWVEMGKAPINRTYVQGVWEPVAKRFIVFGGYNSDGGGQNMEDDTWAYDPYKDEWNQMNATGPVIREDQMMVFNPVNETIIMCGGWNWNWLKDCWEYNYTEDSWTRLADMPDKLVSHTAVWDTHDDGMLVFGGEFGYHSWSDETWAYYRSNDTWIKREPFGEKISFGKAAWDPDEGLMYVVGGSIAYVQSKELLEDLWAFDSSNKHLDEDRTPEDAWPLPALCLLGLGGVPHRRLRWGQPHDPPQRHLGLGSVQALPAGCQPDDGGLGSEQLLRGPLDEDHQQDGMGGLRLHAAQQRRPRNVKGDNHLRAQRIVPVRLHGDEQDRS